MPTTTASSAVADALSRFRAGETVETAPTRTPAPPAERAAAAPVGYARPNGETYFGRDVGAGLIDVELLRDARGATVGENIYVLLYGEPGTGKSASVEAAFPDLVTLAGDGDTTVDDLLGGWVQNPDGTYEYVDGPFVIAAEQGRPLLIDEIALIDPKVMAAPYSAMDGRGKIHIKSNPARGTITVKEGFTLIGACNPNAPGARMSEALLSRFTLHVEATTDYDLAKTMGVPSKVVTVAKNLASKQASGEVGWAPQMRELLAFKRNAERFSLDLAVANLVGIAPEDDRPIVADVVSRAFGSAVAPLRQGAASRA